MGATRFVGRQHELTVLRDAAQRARSGESRLVLIGGESGAGKTRLIDHVATELGSDVRVLRGACVELGAEGLPLAPATAVLRQLVSQEGAAALTALVPDAGALLGLLPEFDGPGPENQARLFDLFAALMRELGSERPVLLVIDDLHWADRSTRDLLGMLARTLRIARVMVVTAHRTDLRRGHPLRPLLAELQRLPGVSRLELGPFTRAEVTELVVAAVGDRPSEAAIEQIHRRSGGNAYFAEELARAGGPAELPGSLSDLLLYRVERLPDASRQVVRLAAVGGRVTPHALLAACAGLDEDEFIVAVRAAADAGVLAPGPDGYAFRIALLREAIVDDLLPAERVRSHRTFARALDVDPRLVEPDRLAAQVAFHWYGAGDGRALPALIRAAETAERVFAPAEQTQMLERVLEMWPRVPGAASVAGTDRLSVFETAISAAIWAGEHLQALDMIDRALAEADPSNAPERAAVLLAQRGMTLANLDRDSSLTAVDEALRLLSPAASATRARVLDLAAAVLAVRGQSERARSAAREATDLAVELGDTRVQTNASTTLGWTSWAGTTKASRPSARPATSPPRAMIW